MARGLTTRSPQPLLWKASSRLSSRLKARWECRAAGSQGRQRAVVVEEEGSGS